MQKEAPRFNVSAEGGATIVEPTDRKILDEVGISQIGEQLSSLLSQTDKPRLVLDFSNVSQMSSSALGMLITIYKRIREKQGELRLCNIAPDIYEIFVITRLNEIFRIFSSRQEAINSLN